MKHNYICIDCETGGLDRVNQLHASKFAITQIAFIIYDGDFKELSRYSSYIKGQKGEPNKEIQDVVNGYVGYDSDLCYQKTAFNITGVSIDKLETSGRIFNIVAKEMCDRFISAKQGRNLPILVGHNVTYDIPFISYLFRYAQIDLSKLVSGYFDHFDTFQPHFIDTMWLARSISDDKDKNDLSSLANRFGVELYDAHDALNDVKATMEIHKKMIQRLKTNSIEINKTEISPRKKFEF